jgi:hypothetical protein
MMAVAGAKKGITPTSATVEKTEKRTEDTTTYPRGRVHFHWKCDRFG